MADLAYWAASNSEEIGAKLSSRIEIYGTSQLTSGIHERYAREFQYYFGLDPGGAHATSQVLRKGEQGELAAIRVNHARPLVNTLLNLIVSPKIVWTPKVVNLDYDSVRECDLASAVLEYYWQEKHVSKFAVRALEEALVFGEGFVQYEWDTEAGEPAIGIPDDLGAPELSTALGEGVEAPVPTEVTEAIEPAEPEADLFTSGSLLKTGDINFHNVSTWDVIRDSAKGSWDELDWVIVRRYINRYNLVAKYGKPGDAKDKVTQQILFTSQDVKERLRAPTLKDETDDIPVYYFYHKRTPALPNGRQVVFLSAQCVLEDSQLKYDDWPLHRVSAGELIGTPYGYTPFLDILGIQELMDSLHTSAATNQSTFGTQLVAMEMGSEVALDDLAGGMKAIYYPAGGKPPEGVNLTRTPPEIFAYLDALKKQQELIFGLNSVVRGEPQSGEQSGSALALLQSQALQQSSVTQANYLRFVQNIGSAVIATFQRYATIPMKVGLVGKANSYLVTDVEYTGADLGRIKRVQVDIGNPLSQTAAGRVEMAKELMAAQLIQSGEQYIQVLTTGRLEPITRSTQNELALIVSENENLAQGNLVQVLDLDEHMLHAREHRAVLANPEARRRPEVVQAVLAHIQDHENAYYNTSPLTLALVGQTPPMPAPANPSTGDPSGGPPSEKPSKPSRGGKLPDPPRPPTNPATGRPWDPVTGGGVTPPPR